MNFWIEHVTILNIFFVVTNRRSPSPSIRRSSSNHHDNITTPYLIGQWPRELSNQSVQHQGLLTRDKSTQVWKILNKLFKICFNSKIKLFNLLEKSYWNKSKEFKSSKSFVVTLNKKTWEYFLKWLWLLLKSLTFFQFFSKR